MGRTKIEDVKMPPPPARRRGGPPRGSYRYPAHHSERVIPSSAESSVRTFPTSAISFHSSPHGRSRRQQRNISIRQLQAAIKYGRRAPAGFPGRSKYSYNGITFVVDDATKREVTSFATPLDLPFKQISPMAWDRHKWAKHNINMNGTTFCKSHSVLVVDISGSMRNSDVQGSRTRLGAVWFAIAEDFIKNRIDSGLAGPEDAISIVLMGEDATIHPDLHNVPTDWVTYNAVLQISKNGSIAARGHGCYRPALALAETILTRYDSSPCALMLAVMSDGRPSDSYIYKQSQEEGTKAVIARLGSLASKLGRRLTVSAVGMGSANHFEVLKTMTDEVYNYGSTGAFMLPSMSSSSIGAAISSIATSLTETQTALSISNDNDSRQRILRKVIRENQKMIPLLTEVVDSELFDIYMGESVTHLEFDPTSDRDHFLKTVPLQHPDAKGVAIAKKPFGEGTERFAYQFFEVGEDGITVVGDPLVAKESRFVGDATDQSFEDINKFVRRFCRLHHQATKVADAFNAKLESIVRLDSDTARVSFITCSVYWMNDPNKGRIVVSVEKRLFGSFQKWNSNNGWRKTRNNHPGSFQSGPLAAIKEEDDNLERSNDIVINIDVDERDSVDVMEKVFVEKDDVAQAFSHFSYIFGGRKSLICDLQGVFDRKERLLCFTDPVIHYYNVLKDNKRGHYGKTDRGEKGIQAFLNSHECNYLCGIVSKGFKTVQVPLPS